MGRPADISDVRLGDGRQQIHRAFANLSGVPGHPELRGKAALAGTGRPALDRTDVRGALCRRWRGIRGVAALPSVPEEVLRVHQRESDLLSGRTEDANAQEATARLRTAGHCRLCQTRSHPQRAHDPRAQRADQLADTERLSAEPHAEPSTQKLPDGLCVSNGCRYRAELQPDGRARRVPQKRQLW